jgi:transposase
MLEMDLVHAIRWKFHKEGLSLREIAAQLGCSRNTVKKYISQAEPAYRRTKKHSAPIRDKAERRIEALIQEWENDTTEKQRITGDRLHTALVAQGFEVGITTVRKIFQERQRQKAEVFIPLVHRPGDEAQVDFFEVTVDEAGVRRKAWMFLMRLMFSKRDFAWLYDGCTQLAFLDGHVRAFQHFGAVPARAVYDNLSAAVKKVVLGRRELTDQMKSLGNHYLFEPCFARIGRGNDKGGVEARGKGIRYQSLTPIPAGDSLAQISEQLLESLEARFAKATAEDGTPLRELFPQELRMMRPLPTSPFPVHETRVVSLSKCSLAKVKGVTYSLPSTWARLRVMAYVSLETVEFRWQDRRVVRERGRKGQRCIRYTDYLRELAEKPQAVRQVAPELVEELGEPYGRLWALLVNSHGDKEGAKVLAKILGAIVTSGADQVTEAVTLALATKRLHLPALGLSLIESRRFVPVPPALEQYVIEASRAADFDRLLAVAG